MLQIAERPRSEPSSARGRARALAPKEEVLADYNDGLLSTAGPIMACSYAVALAIAILTFMGQGEALFAVSISSGFAIVFFMLPYLVLTVRKRHDRRWQGAATQRFAPKVSTFTGSIRRHEAIIQMVIVPLAVVVAFSSFALIWTQVRP
jgi:uncharacterized membrane protein YhaH (DUF805 family)